MRSKLKQLVIILRSEQKKVSKNFHEKIKSVIKHKIDFKHEKIEKFLLLRQVDYQIKLLISDNVKMFKNVS